MNVGLTLALVAIALLVFDRWIVFVKSRECKRGGHHWNRDAKCSLGGYHPWIRHGEPEPELLPPPQTNSAIFNPFGRDAPVTSISEEDVKFLTGTPVPLKLLVPVTIEEDGVTLGDGTDE